MNCEACGHLWSKHGPDGCTAKVYPAHSLEGEPCPCEHTRPRGQIAWRNLYARYRALPVELRILLALLAIPGAIAAASLILFALAGVLMVLGVIIHGPGVL